MSDNLNKSNILFDYDSNNYGQYDLICGIDEAGRGPLAGDVYAAAVILKKDIFIEGLNDSKKLSEKKREMLYDEIIAKSESYCIATASVKEIDEINILQASMLAMKRAVEGLSKVPDIALVDGNRIPENMVCRCEYIIKGDAKSASISAASVLAKVARDRYMKSLALKYPQYCFEKHKGYPTKLHYEMIEKYGASDIHRKTFLKKFYAKQSEKSE